MKTKYYSLKKILSEYKNHPKWKGKIFMKDEETCFKDGLELGYNKANEWHKQDIDDIYDFITEDWSVKNFICIMKDKSLITVIGICDECYNGEVSVNLFFEHNDKKYDIDEIEWWKEIILPEEIKEK